MNAAYKGETEILTVLLAKGANKEATDNAGWTPLILAARYNHKDCVKVLLQYGANVNAKNKYGQTARDYAK